VEMGMQFKMIKIGIRHVGECGGDKKEGRGLRRYFHLNPMRAAVIVFPTLVSYQKIKPVMYFLISNFLGVYFFRYFA
jgi:hypothetical protein